MERALGIFDSGVGGLTVFKAIKSLLPNEDIIYLGDTARVPYGTKAPETVTKYSIANANFLLARGIKLLVVACNTATAYALDELKDRYKIPVIGVVTPGAKKAVRITRTKRVGILGTEGTIRSSAYLNAMKAIDPFITAVGQACPLFVPLAEEGWIDNEVALLSASLYLSNLKKFDVDTVILGCTHYPLLKGVIGRIMGSDVKLIDSANETAIEVSKTLHIKGLLKLNSSRSAIHSVYVTDSPERFMRVGKRFLSEAFEEVLPITLTD